MIPIVNKKFLAVAICSLSVLVSCKSSDNTIVIKEAPVSPGRTDTTVQESTNDRFQQLTIGEVTPIRALDPLFVENAAGMRAVQLLYEGLVRYNENGEIVPAVAKSWTAGSDSLSYRFNLKNDIFYHDSNVFPNGLGRKLTARDVKLVFERMAQRDVPSRAAQLFMDIRGFEPYYREQHQVLQPEDRQLESISGIQVPNDSTITFSLAERDPHFLNKLATPFAVIYPKEAVTSNGFKAVGSGPFKLSQKRNDGLYIFSKFENYRIDDQPILSRVDIRTGADERALFNALSRNEVQLIPQLGPQHMQMLLTENGQLKDEAADNLQLHDNKGQSTYFVRYYDQANLSKNEVVSTLLQADKNALFSGLPRNSYKIIWPSGESSAVQAADSLTATFTDDPFIHRFYSQLNKQLASDDISFSMSSSRIPNRNTPIFTEAYFSSYATQMNSPSALITLSFNAAGVSQNSVQNIGFNSLPWWIDLRQTSVL